MSRVKYQHYVPRFYLEGFQSRAGKLWCYDKMLDKAYQQSPDRLGGERLFYDLPEAEMKIGIPQFLEKWFNPLEADAASTLKTWRHRLRTIREFSPIADELAIMSRFIAVQELRTPKSRKSTVEIASMAATVSFYNYLGEKRPDLAEKIGNPFEEIQFDIPKEQWAYTHARTLIDVPLIEEIAAILLGHIWFVSENNTEWTHYTSDHPVTKYPHAKHPIRSMSGFRSPGIQIMYPLSPKHCLNLFERTFWKQHEHLHGEVFNQPLTNENMEFYNSAQVIHSSRFIYCQQDAFDMARDMCLRDAELRNPNKHELVFNRLSEVKPSPPDETSAS